MAYNVAVVGATGAVGQMMIKILKPLQHKQPTAIFNNKQTKQKTH